MKMRIPSISLPEDHSESQHAAFLELLKEYSDDFAWTHTDISLDSEVTT